MNDDPTLIGAEQPQQRRARAMKQARSYTPQHYNHVAAGAALSGSSTGTSTGVGTLTQGEARLSATGTFRSNGTATLTIGRAKHAGGPKPGVTASPDFAGRLLAVVKAHIDEYDRDPGPTTAAASFGKSYSTLNRWLSDHRLKWSDVVIAASHGSLRKGEDYLASLQQKRRQQRV